jgi:hypothetical protein
MAGSYRATVSGRQSFDAVGAPAEVQQALSGLGGETRFTLEAESQRRMSGTIRVPVGTTILAMQMVLYDGTAFFSRDGREWRRVGGELVSLVVEPALKAGAQDLADNLVRVRAAGRTTFAGAPAVRYSGAIDPNFMLETLGPIFQQVGLDPGVLKFEAGDGYFLVRSSDGQLVFQRGIVTASVDLSKLPGGPDGTMSIRAATRVRYTDHGTPIRVRRPNASGTVSTILELGQFLTAP